MYKDKKLYLYGVDKFCHLCNDICMLILLYKNTLHGMLDRYLACLSVHLYPINVRTAEPIGPKIFEATHMTPGKLKFTKSCLQQL